MAINFPANPTNGQQYSYGLQQYYWDAGNNSWTSAFSVGQQVLANTAGVSFAGDLYFPTGNVAIGASSPTGQFSVYNSGSAAMYAVGGSVGSYLFSSNTGGLAAIGTYTNHPFSLYSNGLECVRINSGGYVGINTTLTPFPLSVNSEIRLQGTAYSKVSWRSNFGATDEKAWQMYTENLNNGSANTWVLGTINDAENAAADAIRVYRSGYNVSKVILGSGTANVGIGTTTPTARLTIDGGATQDQIRLYQGGSPFGFRIGRDTSTGLLNFYGEQTGATGYLFNTVNGERLRIDPSGNVGISTAAPTYKLDVTGTGHITGAVTFDSLSGILKGNATSPVTAAARGTDYSLITAGTTVASTSGSSIDFTSIPSGVRRITIMFANVSTNGSSITQVQIGSGSVTTSGYTSTGTSAAAVVGTTNLTTGFIIYQNNAGNFTSGHMTLTHMGSNVWVASSVFKNFTNTTCFGAGDVTLGGALDRVRVTTVNGTDAFDSGSINIFYEY